MPQDMAHRIDALAKEDFCPMNAYILRMLRDGLKLREAEGTPDTLRPAPRAQQSA